MLFSATCSPYLLQEILQTHFSENDFGHLFVDKFYVDNYMNRYDDQFVFIKGKVTLDKLMLDANMRLQEWVSNDDFFNVLYNLNLQETQNDLGLDWEPQRDTLHIASRDKIAKTASC